MNIKKRFGLLWSYLLVLSVISLTIFVINGMDDSHLPKVINDINSGVVGAILTTIITLLLLNNQNDIQESQLKNSVIYEEKLKLFNDFLGTLNRSLEDNELTPSEMKNIIFHFSVIHMHISDRSAKSIEQYIQSINEEFFYVDENYIPKFESIIYLYNGICNVLRHELYQNDEAGPMDSFTFPNFKQIAFKKRSVKLPIKDIFLAVEYYQNNSKIYCEDKQGARIQFNISPGNIENLKAGFGMIKNIIDQMSNVKLEDRFLLNQQEINGEKYLGLFNWYIYFGSVQVATFGLSQKNRVYLKIKMEKESVYSFEPGENVYDFEENIKKELNNFIGILSQK